MTGADCRVAFAETLIALAETDRRIVAVVNDSVGSSNLKEFKRRFPDRLINVGIAEQNLVGVSAGLASAGKIPFTCGASCFLTGRALEQVKADLAYSRHNVKLCGMSSGMAYGELGPTHHSIEDLAWTRAIANLTVIVPADPIETAARGARRCRAPKVPVFLRLSRMPVPTVTAAAPPFEIGRAATLRPGRDVTIVAAGVTVGRALAAADALAAGRHRCGGDEPVDHPADRPRRDRRGGAARADCHGRRAHGATADWAAPLPKWLSRPIPCGCGCWACPGVFAPTGSPEFLLDHFGLTPEGIRAAARDFCRPRVNSANGSALSRKMRSPRASVDSRSLREAKPRRA